MVTLSLKIWRSLFNFTEVKFFGKVFTNNGISSNPEN